MLKLPKKVEYAILAVQYIAGRNGELVSAKDIADGLELPYEFLAKALQTLYKKGIIIGFKGVKGGYRLSDKADNISLGDILDALDSRPALVDCTNHDHSGCTKEENCSLKDPITYIQKKINNLFDETTIENLLVGERSKIHQIDLQTFD